MKRVLFIALCLLFVVLGGNAQYIGSQQNGESSVQYQEINLPLSSSKQIQSSKNVAISSKGIRAQSVDATGEALTAIVPVPLRGASPLLALGVLANVENRNEGQLEIELRYSTDQALWSDWHTIAREEHSKDGNVIAYALQILPKETKQVQLRLKLTGSTLRLNNLRLCFISPGEMSSTSVNQQRGGKASHTLSDSPPEFVSRTGWGCPEGQSSPRWLPVQTNVTHLIVHHTATTNSAPDWGAAVRAIWVYHANSLDWGDIGYSWLIDPNGVIYQGRAWLNDSIADVRAGHFCGVIDDPNGINNNEQTMGVGMLGTFSAVLPTKLALTSLRNILAWKANERDIDPYAVTYHPPTGLTLHTITGHRDGCATECPGESLYASMPLLRQRVSARIAPPVITSLSTGSLMPDNVTIKAEVNASGNMTEAYFEWGETSLYGNVTEIQPVGNDTTPRMMTATLSGLHSGWEYHFRCIASNSETTVVSHDAAFVTVGWWSHEGEVPSGWSLVSNPVWSQEQRRSALFSHSLSAYEYLPGVGYRWSDSIIPGRGYWLHMPFTDTQTFEGGLRSIETLRVESHWNLIGALSLPTIVSTIRAEPDSIIASPFYGYVPGAGYQAADTLQPLRAYWVKTNAGGTITLHGPPIPLSGKNKK